MRLTKEELLNLQNHDELLAEVDRLRLDNDFMKKELDFWTKSTTMGARDWCDRLRRRNSVKQLKRTRGLKRPCVI